MRRKFVGVVTVSVLALSTLRAQDAKIVAKAKVIYLEKKDAKLGDDKRTFSQGVLDDFNELQEAGITHPDLDKIKALLTTHQEGI